MSSALSLLDARSPASNTRSVNRQSASPRSLERNPKRHIGARTGMTLIEVMFALGMVAFAAASSARYTAGFAHAVVTESGRAQANDLVAQRLEDVSAATDYDGLEESFGATEQLSVGGATYSRLTVLRHVGGGALDADDYKVVTVIVSGPTLKASIQNSIVIAQF